MCASSAGLSVTGALNAFSRITTSESRLLQSMHTTAAIRRMLGLTHAVMLNAMSLPTTLLPIHANLFHFNACSSRQLPIQLCSHYFSTPIAWSGILQVNVCKHRSNPVQLRMSWQTPKLHIRKPLSVREQQQTAHLSTHAQRTGNTPIGAVVFEASAVSTVDRYLSTGREGMTNARIAAVHAQSRNIPQSPAFAAHLRSHFSIRKWGKNTILILYANMV